MSAIILEKIYLPLATQPLFMSYFEEIAPDMDKYLEKNTSEEPILLQELREETYQNVHQPHMLSGKQQGRLLSILSRMLRPNHILEIGTFTGYATLCLAEGLSENGKITTLDINEELSPLPKKYFEKSPFSHQINFLLEDAMAFLETTEEKFDLVFIDADKARYPLYFEKVKACLAPRGVILFDNVLWYGKVLEESPKKKATKAIQALNEIISQDEDFENVIVPIRDGLNILIKK